MITFRKKNDISLEFSGDRGDLQMLSDYFTFEVEGAKFSPAYRNKFWDGKIRLANLREGTIPYGLWKDIIKFSKTLDVEVEFEGNRFDFPGRELPVDEALLDGFIEALQLSSRGQPITPRDYQKQAFVEALRNQRCLLLSPTASGKSLIIYLLTRWWREVHNRKILIIVPTVGLVTQMQKDFLDYSNNKFDDVHTIMSGSHKETDSRVVVSTWQSIYKMPAGWFAQFGSVIVDEVHTATAKSLQGIMNKLIVCPDRIGLTGTLKDAKTHELALKGMFGPISQVTTTKELIDSKHISDMSIRMLQLRYNKDDINTCKRLDYQEEISFLIEHEKRNNYVAKLAATLPGNTLVIFSRLEHGQTLTNLIENHAQERPVRYVAGSTDREEREIVRQLAESTSIIIVASLGVFSTGVNIRNLHNLIFAHPTKSKIKVLQSVGRVLRKSDDGRAATIYDIVDDLKSGSRSNFALRHANERFKHYQQEQFDYKITSVDL